jgi:N4-gp56 family major capsid protein
MSLNTYANKLATAQQNNIKLTEYFSDRLLEIIKLEASNFVFSNLGKDVVIPKNEGTTTITMRRYNSLPVRNLSGNAPTAGGVADERLVEGVANRPLQVEAHRVDVSVDQYGAWIEITDRVQDIHMDDIKAIYQPELARHAAEVRERAILAKFADASEYFIGGVATEAQQLLPANVLTMRELRKVALSMRVHKRKGHTAFGLKPVAVLHPAVMEDLLDDQDLKDRILVPGQENAVIKMGTLQSYMFYGMYVIDTLIAEDQIIDVSAVATAITAIPTSANVGDLFSVTTQITDFLAPGVYQFQGGALATVGNYLPVEDFTVYTSYFLGYEPYVVSSLGGGNVEFKMTGFEATKDDPLGQRATFGYKMWTGAKVIDPVTIVKLYSRSAFDLLTGVSLVDTNGWEDTAAQA